MTYILYTLLSGFFSGVISILFRGQELRNKIILMPRQLITQLIIFASFAYLFHAFFSHIYIEFGSVRLGWFSIFLIFSSFAYYATQVFYEFFSGNSLFASEQEMLEYIEKIEEENSRF